MTESRETDKSKGAALDSLIAAWVQSNSLPQVRADAILRAVKQDASVKVSVSQNVGARSVKIVGGPNANLPSHWWFGFAHDLAGSLTQASRSWSHAGGIVSVQSE